MVFLAYSSPQSTKLTKSIFLAERMLGDNEVFKGGRVDRDALVGFIKDIKKNTNLSDEDAAVMAASKVSDSDIRNISLFNNFLEL